MASILQLNPPIQVHTKLGDGWAILVLDYNININTVWVVRLDETGEVKHLDANDIKIAGNLMLNLPLIKTDK